jgi:hypothetical protein
MNIPLIYRRVSEVTGKYSDPAIALARRNFLVKHSGIGPVVLVHNLSASSGFPLKDRATLGNTRGPGAITHG